MARRRPRYDRLLAQTAREDRSALLEALEDWLDRMRSLNRTVPILVEGRNDERALRQLGFTGPIYHLHAGGVSIYERCKWLEQNTDRVVLLLDWDRRGRQLRRRVIRFLESDWETYDEYRSEIEGLVGEFVHHIEDLVRFYESLYITVHYEPVE